MKVFIANESSQKQGGGFSWANSFQKGMGDLVTGNYAEATHVMVPGASMVKPELAEEAHREGKRVILRIDNALKHSRNGGKGMARMQRIAAFADLVIYQCQWAKDYLDEFLGHPNSTIIYNGVDLSIFKPEGERLKFNSTPIYLYASAAKGENKRWHWAWYSYQMAVRKFPNALLLIAGRVPTEVMENNFDFFQGEDYRYLGMVQTSEEMAKVYRSAQYLYAVFELECYSQTYLEAAMCGAHLVQINLSGGTPELLKNLEKERGFNGLDRMVSEYKLALEALV